LVLEPLLRAAEEKNLALLKIHGHPNGRASFSEADDESDRLLFSSVFGWTVGDRPHVSAVMLPDGRIFGRAVDVGGTFRPLQSVLVVGHDIVIEDEERSTQVEKFMERHAQLFGEATTQLLRRLRVAIVGCSGTGSLVIEQLARLGVGELVLVDPDRVEERNLNRIVGATQGDVGRQKVDVLADYVERIGLGTVVHRVPTVVEDRNAISLVAVSDVVMGCLDVLGARHLLSRLAQFYLLPYVDVGVKLEALRDGTINQVAGGVHYLTPTGPDFLDRGVFQTADLEAEDLFRSDPDAYRERREKGYVRGVRVDRPAVISVNMVFAGLAVNELLARLHPFRMEDNATLAGMMLSLSHLQFVPISLAEAGPPGRRPWVGRGETEPPLGMPALGARG
jgi:hypothetical protein